VKSPALILKPATYADLEYLYRLSEETMRGYVEATWGEWHESVTRTSIGEDIASGKVSLVWYGDAVVGMMSVDDQPTQIHLDKLYLAPDFQNRRIGTQLLQELMLRATAEGKPLRLRVLAVNPAKRLYERLGFVVTGQTRERYFMEYVHKDMQP
jgi:ribosomal protein S18 acetylase RimI-like enzyme